MIPQPPRAFGRPDLAGPQAGASALGRVPPHDREAEQSVLGALLLDQNAAATVRDVLRPEDFYEERHRHVFQAALELSDRGEPIDLVTLRAQLERAGTLSRSGGVEYLAELSVVTPTAASVKHYADIVVEHAIRRRLISAGGRVTETGFDEQLRVEDALDMAEQIVFQISDQRSTTEATHIAPVLKDTWSQLETLLGGQKFITGVPTNFSELDNVTQGLQSGELIILAARPSVGKALAVDTPIPTPQGWRTMGELRVGDQVFDECGRACTVTFATPVMHDRECYEVTFSDGSTIVADADHLWATSERAARKRGDLSLTVRTTREIVASLRTADGRANHAIPTCAPLEYPERALPVDPYTLGIWLGDGHSSSASIPVSDADAAILDEIRIAGVTVRRNGHSPSRTPVYRLGGRLGAGGCRVAKLDWRRVEEIRAGVAAGATQRSLAAEHGVSVAAVSLAVNRKTWTEEPGDPSMQVRLRQLGVLGNKHIPREYLEASPRQRVALLQGLMDSDGHVRADGLAEFCSTSVRLADGVVELATSLGIVPYRHQDRARLAGVDMGPRYRVTFTTSQPVFRLPRKLARLRTIGPGEPSRSRRIHDVRPVASVPVRCITVDSPNRLYLAGRACIPTHNTSFALNLARNAAVLGKKPVAVFSLEMSKESLVQRLLCSEAHVDSFLLKTGQADAAAFSRIAQAMDRLTQAELWIDDTPALSISAMRSRARRMKAQHKVALIIVDYLQLMHGGRQESRVQEVSDISSGLKSIAKELQIPIVALSQLSRESERRTDRRPQLSDLRDSGCLVGSSQVFLPDEGRCRPISELVGRSGFRVLALDRTTWKLVPRPVLKAFPTGHREVFDLTTRLGRTIRATANHQFLTLDGWKRLDELQPGDHLALPRRLPSRPEPTMTDAELALLGHLIGDGCTLPRHAIQYTTADAELAERVVRLARTVFGDAVSPRIVRERNWFQVYLPASARLTHRRRNPVAAWLDGLGVFGLRSHDKFVPAAVFEQPREQIAVFLRHLWSTDGCIHAGDPDRPIPIVYYATSSRRLAGDVQSLLLRLGLNARLAAVSQGAKGRLQHHVLLRGHADLVDFLDEVGALRPSAVAHATAIIERSSRVLGKPNRDVIPAAAWRQLILPAMSAAGTTQRAFAASMGSAYNGTAVRTSNLSRLRASRIADAVHSEQLLRLAISDVYWDPVSSITPAGSEDVYDLTVGDLHSFVVNDIVVHNSIEQDADIVLFLYREGMHNQEVDKSITQLIVAKNRNGPVRDIDLVFVAEQTAFREPYRGRPEQ